MVDGLHGFGLLRLRKRYVVPLCCPEHNMCWVHNRIQHHLDGRGPEESSSTGHGGGCVKCAGMFLISRTTVLMHILYIYLNALRVLQYSSFVHFQLLPLTSQLRLFFFYSDAADPSLHTMPAGLHVLR